MKKSTSYDPQMRSEPASISSEEKLAALRKVDIFHHWDSLDEKRLCVRCGQIISGREIKVIGGKRGDGPMRLECPTEGCASVPIEWLMIEPAADPPLASEIEATVPPAHPDVPAPPPPAKRLRRYLPPFGFLRVTPLLV